MAPRALKPNIELPEMQRTPEREEEQRTRLGLVLKFVSLLIFFVLMFLLAHSMVQHHFFTGGAMDYHNRPTGP
jgi:hypothetical protein